MTRVVPIDKIDKFIFLNKGKKLGGKTNKFAKYLGDAPPLDPSLIKIRYANVSCQKGVYLRSSLGY